MATGFSRHKNGSLVYYTVDSFDKTGLVRHGFSTRLGGVSSGETATLNLGFNKRDTRENVLKNYEIICSSIGIDSKKLVLSNQIHQLTVAQQVDIHYLSAPKGEKLIAKATCRKSGRTSSIINVDVSDDTGRDVAQFIGTGFKLDI